MADQAIISGARGLVFFGGRIGEVMSPRDARNEWNWTFWHTVLKPLVHELTSTAVGPCLTAPTVSLPVAADATDVRMSAREAAGFLYLLTCRRSPTAPGPVRLGRRGQQSSAFLVARGSRIRRAGARPAGRADPRAAGRRRAVSSKSSKSSSSS